MQKSKYTFTAVAFFVWLIVLLVIIFLSTKVLPLQENFLGGGLTNYLKNPYFWAFGNYDGEHYVSIARLGYGFGEHAFFPLYPILIKLMGNIFGSNLVSFNLSGIIISLAAFSKFSVLALLVFPTSFYFGAIYTESLFFALAVWALFMARQKKWLVASILAMLLTATRFVGIIIIPVILVEWLMTVWKNKDWLKKLPWSMMITPLGLFSYMYFLLRKVGDQIAFFNNVEFWGTEVQSSNTFATGFLPLCF